MEQNRAFGIQQPNFHLDSQTALDNIRGARSVTIAPLDIGSPDEVAEPATTPKRQLGLNRSVPAPSEVKQIFIEPFGPAVERAPAPAAEPVAIKPNQPAEEGFFTGAGKALFGGVQDTGGSLYSAGATAVGSNSSVVESSKAAAERQKNEPIELSKFKQNIATRQQAGDDTIWQGIKNVAGAAYDNPEGAFQMLVNQLPNSGVALASGWAGAQGGSALGTLVAPGPGTVFGGIAGFLTGLFAANVSLEVGGKAQEKARDGNFTDAERSEALKEGTTKGAIITGVDALTLGGSKWVLGAANRAVETATVKTLQEAGIDTTKTVAAIKDAQRAALEATAKSGREAATDAMSKATLAVMEREGLTAPELVSRVQGAQKAALESVNNLKNRLGRGAAAVGLESAGEGIGEYLGELAATGKASPTEAVLEALTSLPLSIGELNAVAKIDKPGILTESTNLIGKTDTKKDPLTGETTKQMPFGSPDMTPNLTVLNDRRYMQTASYFDRAIKNNKDDLLNSMAAIYNQVEQSKNDKAASDEQKQQADAMLNVIKGAANRLSLSSQFESKIASATAIASGTEFLSQYPDMRERLIGRMTDIATTMPANTTPKKDNRRQETSSAPLTEEDVMNMPFPDEESTGSSTSTPGKKIDIGGVAGAADPVSQMANYIKSISNPEGTAALGGFKEGAVDKYGVVPWVSEDGTKRLFTHNSVPDFVFNSREDAIHAQQALKLANEQMKQRREQRAAEGLNQNQSAPKDDGSSSLDDLDLLYSKEPSGKVKAAFFKDLKRVYYSRFAWHTGDGGNTLTRKQFKALELHEIGAHYAAEQMLGKEGYQKLLSDLRAMRGTDKRVDEAYASVPADTLPQLVDHEALGYLVENYANMSIVERLIQMITDWYQSKFNGKTLTATEVQSLIKQAFNAYEKEIKRIYLRENISSNPKGGRVKVDFQSALDSNKDAKQFLDFMSQFGDKVSLSGSLALSAQRPVYRPANEQIHDLDFRVMDKEDLPEIMAKISEKYPNSGVSVQWSSQKTKSDVVSISLDINDKNALNIDLFTNLGDGKYQPSGLKHTYTGTDGTQRSIGMVSGDDVFEAKMNMNRAKDVNDAIASDAFDVAFSKEKPTVSDLIKALPNVVKDIITVGEDVVNKESRVDPSTGKPYLFVTKNGEQGKDFNDLMTLVRRRMQAKPAWASLESKLTPAMIKQAYAKATGELVSQSSDEDAGTFKAIRTKSAEQIKEEITARKEAKKEREKASQEKPAKEQSFVAQRLSALEQEIKSIADKYTSAAYYNGAINEVLAEIAAITKEIQSRQFFDVKNEDGSVTTFVRRSSQEANMESQVESTGRISRASDYYDTTGEATFENPDSIMYLEARRAMLEKELQVIRSRKLSKAEQAGRLGVRKIRMDIDAAIQRAVADGLPIEATVPLGREWLGGLDGLLRSSKIDKAEAKAKQSQELKEFYERRNQAIEQVNIPEDYDFAFGLAEGMLSIDERSKKPKVSAAEAMDLIDKAQSTGEIESKKDIYRLVLKSLAETYGNAKDLNIKGVSMSSRLMSDLMALSTKARREGLLNFDEFKSIFNAAKVSVPHEILRLSEVAASKRLLDFTAEHGKDPAYRFYWLRSMDRLLKFNPDFSQYFTAYEQSHYDEWKSEVSAINNRLRKVSQEGGTGNLLYNRFTLDEMRNPDSLSTNTRTRLQELYPDLVDAYFGDMLYALRTGKTNIVELKSKLATAEDRKALQDFIDRKNRLDEQQAERLERQDYFKDLSQFTHIDDKSFDKLYAMMKVDSVKNLPMILDMAEMMEESALLNKSAPFSFIDNKRGAEDSPVFLSASEENEAQNFEQLVASAVQRSLMGKGVSDAVMRSRRDPIFNFDSYRDGVEGRHVSFEESDGEQNRYGREDESVEDRLMYGEDTELSGLIGNDNVFDDINPNSNEDGDEARLRQGQYVGYLNTAVVMNMVNNITKSWKNAPNIVVLQNHLQLPEGLRDRVSKKLGKGMGAKGLFDGSTGTIYLFSNFLSSQDDVQFTLFHEAYGHLGLRLMFGQEFDQFLENAYNSNPVVRQDVDAQLRRGGIGKLEAIEETLSEYAGQNKEPSVVKDFIGRIIAGLRRIGLDRVANYIGGFTDAELAYSLKAAKDYAQNFGRSPLIAGPDDIRLSSDKPPYEIFAKKGANTTGYARYDPLTGEYYLFKATGNDIRQGSKMEILKTYDEVVQKMDKLGVLERRVRSGFFRDNKMPSDFVKYLNSQQVGWLQKKMDGFLRSFQNQYLPVFRIVEQMEKEGRVTESLDLRRFLRLNERQTAVKVEDFNRNYVQPIMDLIREAEQVKGQYLTSEGATDLYSMLNKFLLAQTAEERNRQVNKRDPESYAGSGMASESSVLADPQKHPEDTAKKVLDFVASQPYAKQFEEIGKKLDAMSRAKVQWEVASGLITKEEGAARDAAYRHYRNLSGINSMLDDDYTGDPSLNIGRKFNLRGKDKYATGRTDEAPDILARTIVGAEAAIIRGQKNLVAQRILAFFETNYDPNFVSINEQSFRRVVDPQTQFIELRENTNYLNQPDVMVVKVNGRVVTIRFKDAGHTSIAEAIHGKVEPQSEHPFRQIMRIWGRFAGSMITKYNMFWIPVNFVRDVQTLFLNSGVDGKVGWKMAGQMFKALGSSMYTTLYAALDEMRPETSKGKKARDFLKSMLSPNQEMLDHYRRGRSQGAFTSFINHKNLEDQIIQINESIGGKSAVGKIEGLLKFWEVMTIPVEMAPRLAAYSVMVKNGRSEIEAADYAGQVTVDFNMRGSNEFVRAAYLFFNPAVQGTAQLFKLAKNNPKQFGIVAGALMTLGFLSTALVRGLDIDGDEDEDKKKNRKERGMSALDEVPDYKRSTSLILMPNQAFGAIPVAYGWNAFFAAGAFLADSVVGKVPPSLSFKRTLQAGLEAFSPVGGSGFDFTKVASDPVGQAVALLAPTVAAPMAQWYTNTSRYGGPLYPTNQFNSAVGASDTTKAFSSVNPIARGFAESLQELTGGDRRNQRGIDLNPALIDHMVQSYMPGIATEMYKGAGVAIRKAQGLDVPRDKQPLVDRFSANAQEAFDNSAYHRVSQAVHAAWNELDKHPSTDQRYKDILKQHPDLGKMMDVVRAAESELRAASSQLKKAEDDAYILRKDGQIERADAMDKANVELRNKTEKAKRLVYTRVVNQAAKSGFKDEIYSD